MTPFPTGQDRRPLTTEPLHEKEMEQAAKELHEKERKNADMTDILEVRLGCGEITTQ